MIAMDRERNMKEKTAIASSWTCCAFGAGRKRDSWATMIATALCKF
jgi:hypothetical protein